jgi:ATP-dependent RNA helicase DHX36
VQLNGKIKHLTLIANACCLNIVFAVHGNKQVVIPLSLQRRVEGLVQEHLDRALLPFDKDGRETESGSEKTEPANLDERQDPLLDQSVMEKVLQRKSIRMRNFQRSWQV